VIFLLDNQRRNRFTVISAFTAVVHVAAVLKRYFLKWNGWRLANNIFHKLGNDFKKVKTLHFLFAKGENNGVF